jgi:tight adherence protein C
MLDLFNGGQWFTVALFGLAAMLGVGGVAMIALRAFDVKERAIALSGVPSSELGFWQRFQSWLAKVSAPVAKLARPKDDNEVTGLRAKFAQAGWRNSSSIPLYFGVRAILALLLPFAILISLRLSNAAISTNQLLFFTLFGAALGYYLPVVYFARVRENRKRDIFESFPDAIDLMVVCVEAGLGLDMAISRCGKEMAVRSSNLADELSLIGTELRMGASRERALRNFASRTGVPEISMFTAMVLQADKFGTSVADALRVHAEELRLRRRLVAEEKAAKIPLKLLFPLIFCIFPALLLVLLGPAFISILNAFKNLGTS